MSGDPVPVAVRFNEAINAEDLVGLEDLMTDDHRFVDTAGATVAGRESCMEAWRGFFQAYPDYGNIFTSTTSAGDIAIAVGQSVCAEPALDGPAIWTATIRGNRVAQWRVYQDTPQARRELGIDHRAAGRS